MKLIYGFICANLTVGVLHIGYIYVIFYRQGLWMKALDRDDQKGMDKYSLDGPCWIGLNKFYLTTLSIIYGVWLLVGWRFGEAIRFW